MCFVMEKVCFYIHYFEVPEYYSCYTFFLRNDIITAVKHKMQGVGYHFIEPLIKKDMLLRHIFKNVIACPSAWTIRVSFFYVPENYPNTIREKKQSPWTIQILSQKFWQNVVKKTNTWNYPRKKTNTLNYPNTIRYFLDSSNTLVFFLFWFFKKKVKVTFLLKFLSRFIRAFHVFGSPNGTVYMQNNWNMLLVSAAMNKNFFYDP